MVSANLAKCSTGSSRCAESAVLTEIGIACINLCFMTLSSKVKLHSASFL